MSNSPGKILKLEVLWMAKITVKADTCKGCGLCMTACPRKIIGFDRDKINSKGYHPAVLLDDVPGLRDHCGKVVKKWQNEY